MKLSFLTSFSNYIKSHKKIAFGGLLVLCAGLIAAIYFGWREYQYRQSAAYAFEQLKQALNPPKVEELAKMIDFNSIGTELAQTIKKVFPFYMEGQDQERKIRNRLQNVLLKRFSQKEEKKQQLDLDDEQGLLNLPLEILPSDFINQLTNGLSLRETGEYSAIISAKVDQPLLGRNFTLVFGMNKTSNGWKVNRFLNVSEIAGQIREAMLERHIKLRNVYEHKNMLTMRRMEQLLPMQSCSVNAGLLSDGKTLIMTVEVIGRNKGNIQINNFNVDTNILGKNGKTVAHRFLNVAKPVAPGEDFNHRWNFELEANSDLGRAILQNRPLRCDAKWQTLGLNSSEVLHILELPHPDRQCAIGGHDHPDGFCQLPVFNN